MWLLRARLNAVRDGHAGGMSAQGPGADDGDDALRTRIVETVDGGSLAVQELGPPDGPPLLLLSGQANSHRWWSRVRDELAAEHRTISFDYRGTGGSSGVEVGDRDWSTSSFAADAALVLDALAVEQACVYGTSMGGRVAQMLALDHPEKVHRLALACTSPGGSLATERDAQVRRGLADPDWPGRREFVVGLFYSPDGAAEFGPGSPLLGDPTMTAAAAGAHLKASARHDACERLRDIDCPTLVLHGEEDVMVPTCNAPVLAEEISGARLALVPQGRHGFFEEFAWIVTPAILDFFAE